MVNIIVKKKRIKDLINKQSKTSKSDLVWEVDLLYYPKRNSQLGLKQQVYFLIVDCFSKYCLAIWNVTSNQTAINFKTLILIFLEEHLTKFNRQPKIIHSDYGIQFSSKLWSDFNQELEYKDIKLSLANKKAYNTYAINYFTLICRMQYLNLLQQNFKNTEDIDSAMFSSIKRYNNEYIGLFNTSAKKLYFNMQLAKAKNIITNNVNFSYKAEHKYIDYIKETLIKNKELELETYHMENRILDSSVFNIVPLINIAKVKKVTINIIPRKVRTTILEKNLLYMLNIEEMFFIKNHKIYEADLKRKLQIKIGILLLFLTGCRISEISGLTFYDIEVLLKEGSLRIWINKDLKTRVIYLRNKKLLNLLDKFYYNLKNYCLTSDIFVNFKENHIFFKLKKINGTTIAHNINTTHTMKETINSFLNYLLLSIPEFKNQVWSTHSFRHSLITKLINKFGIEKTSEFIGHKHIATTQLYYHKESNTKLLKELANHV